MSHFAFHNKNPYLNVPSHKNTQPENKNEIINLKYNFAHPFQLVKLKPKEIKVIALHISN